MIRDHNLQDDLQQIPEISQLGIFGTREYEIAIEVSEQRLREYGLSFEQVTAAVRQSNLNMAGGTIRTINVVTEAVSRPMNLNRTRA